MKKLAILWLIVLMWTLPAAHAENGLVAYWPFDNDFTNAEGTADFDGQPAGTAVISAQDVVAGGGALKIDDDTTTQSHVSVLGDFVGPHPVVSTVVGWYKYEDISGDGSDTRNFIWETQPTYSLSFGIRDGAAGKYSQWYFDTDQGALNGAGPTVNDGQWHHAAVVWSSVLGHIKYYHDGVLHTTVDVDKTNNPVLGQAGFNIGTHRAADGARNWDGYLDEIAVFSIELSDAQIAGLYHQPGTVNPGNVTTEIPDLTLGLSSPVNTRVYREDMVLTWAAPQIGDWTYTVWMGLDPTDLSVVASDISDLAYMPTDIEDADPMYFWKVTGSSNEWGTIESDVASFQIYLNQGLVAYWPFDKDYMNAQGNARYDGVEVDTGNCVDISSEDVKRGTGALKINDNDVLTHGLIQIEESPFFGGQKTLSIVGWYKFKDIAGDGAMDRPFVFETGSNYVISYGTRSEENGRDVGEWYILGTPGFSDTSGPIDSNETWHHVALTYNATKGTAAFYFDGQLHDSVQGTPYEQLGDGLGAHDSLNIGDYRVGDGGRMFDGYIDDMAAYDIVLSSRQITAIYEGVYEDQTITPGNVLDVISDVFAKSLSPVGKKFPLNTTLAWEAPADVDDPEYNVYFGTDPGVVSDTVYMTTTETTVTVPLDIGQTYYWKVDVVSGPDTFEGTLLAFSTVEGLVAYYPFDTDFTNVEGNPLYDGVATGHVETSGEDRMVGNGALKIDDYTNTALLVTIAPSPLVANQKQVTVTGWYMLKDISGDGVDSRPFVLESNDYHVSYGLRLEDDLVDGGEWYFRGAPGFSDTSGPLILLNDPWHHFALVYDADQGYAAFYFDGELIDQAQGDPGTGLNETTYINIGDYRAGDGGRNFDGYIDDIAFFDVILTADQIKAMYLNPGFINGGNILDQE